MGAGGLGRPYPGIARGIHPVATESVASVELRATSAGADPPGAQHLAGEVQEPPVQVRVHAQHPVGPVLLELFDEGPHPEELPPPAVQRRMLQEGEVEMVRAGPVHLHEVVDMKPEAVVRARRLQGREGLDLHPELRMLARPFREGAGARIVAAAGAGAQDQEAQSWITLVFSRAPARSAPARRRRTSAGGAMPREVRRTPTPATDCCRTRTQIMAVPPFATTVSPTM